MSTSTLILIYFVVTNILGFASMGIDKLKAKNHAWRIPEARLFFYAAIGGALGSFLGMKIFRHKTRHWYFVIGIPALLVVWLVLLGFLVFGNVIPIEIW